MIKTFHISSYFAFHAKIIQVKILHSKIESIFVYKKQSTKLKPIKLFYQARCPFCKRAFNYIDELKKRPEYKDIVIETIEETEHPDIADQYDYYYVPTFYIADEKVHEGGIYPNEVEAIFKKALVQE